jgi:hypothetical protein
MLRIPRNVQEWATEIVDETMASAGERSMVYTAASQYYYHGTNSAMPSLHNKTKPFVDRLAGFLMQPTDVRFNISFDSTEPKDVLERAEVCSEKLTADFRQSDADITFAECVLWSLINGCYFLKAKPAFEGFKVHPVHPQNLGVLAETVLSLEEQEAFCHVTFPTVSRLMAMLDEQDHPRRNEIFAKLMEARESERDEEEPSYFHQMVVGGLNPVGDLEGNTPPSSGIVNVFPTPSPWRPQRKISRTVRFCELWIKDANRDGDYTTLQLIYPDILLEGENTRRNLSKIPGKSPFVKIQNMPTPGYFWGRPIIADVQMLQDLINKRLSDLKLIWDRNARAPKAMAGYTNLTDETYLAVLSAGTYINDPNPNAKVQELTQPPPPNYLEELEFVWKMFDEASGFTPIMGGQGEPGVRAGVHAQTLVRTSSPPLITQAARIERQLADAGYLAFRLMQSMDPSVYITESGAHFTLAQLPEPFQVLVDSHSASPAFAEDNRQLAIGLARAQAIDAEDLVRMLHPPNAELILARLKQRQKQQAQAAQQEKQEEMMQAALTGKAPSGPRRAGGRR